MKDKKLQLIFNSMLIFVLLQPFLDILSNLYIENILKIGISTYLKPLFVTVIGLILFIKYNKKKRYWLMYGFFLILYIIGHVLLLKNLYVETAIITKELRCIINIIYMIILFFDFNTIYKLYDKKEYLQKTKKTIAITFLIYSSLLIISIITNTSGLTYEYSDALKKGFKGWYDSGQIFGHALSIMFPILIYTILKPRFKWYYRIVFILPIIITAVLIGTRVPYFIILIVFIIYILISIYNKIFNKYYKLNIFNLSFVLLIIITLIIIYPYTPLCNNMKISSNNFNKTIDSYENDKITAQETLNYYDNLIKLNNDKNIKELKKYKTWVSNSSSYLMELYENKIIHPSDTRKKQFYYSLNMFKQSNLKYKTFGIGYLNQFDYLNIETDFFMALFSFGIFGFILFLFIPITEFIKATIYMVKNIKRNDLETYLLYASFGMFFCISMFAGATYIYTNFSIFLVILISMLKCKIDINEKYKKEELEVKKISFLMLHLGYGGIETATINTANALCKKYDVELVSFYKLNNNQINKINSKIRIKYLYNGEPNKEELFNSIKNREIFKILSEGLKSIKILIYKKLLLIREIKKSKSDVLISTRVEFSTLLSKYGKSNKIKIAQEHHHHNNNKKYINKLSFKYDNIDYLLALTKTLEEDYKEFLKYNTNTKIILMPNMIKSKFDKFTDLKEENIIFVGRLHECKKVDSLIKIFSKLDNKKCKLIIIGDGEEITKIKNLIRELKLENRVQLLGYLDQKEIANYLVKSKVFCMTSLTEGLPMVLLEAMSYGVPCIAFDTQSGVKDIIDNDINGYVIFDRNEEEYIKKLDKMLNNKKLLTNMSKNAINKAKSFSEKEIVKKWINIFNKEI